MKRMRTNITTIDKTYSTIRSILQNARSKVYRSVNFIMVQAYWNIGKIIVEEEQKGKDKAKYGSYLIKELSKKLTKDFGKGFTPSNLKYIRQFYLVFPISHTLCDQLSWSHYRSLLKVKSERARLFYIRESEQNDWTVRALERQINSFYYERILSSKDKEPVIKEAKEKTAKIKPENILKDPYVLEFLDLKDRASYRESELEQALIDKLQEFLLELGRGFSFIGRQKRITAENEHFFIDMVFYNYILKCFVLIDLKIGKLTHQDIGQMDMYIRMYEDKYKIKGDNPSIGIILCSEKNEAVVKYSVLKDNKHLFSSKYQLYLPTEDELIKELKRERKLIEQQRKDEK
jgi:predicted nuclease of restriction endonuclease-like (RecB) superfamily